MRRFLMCFVVCGCAVQATAKDYQSRFFNLPVHNATAIMAAEPVETMVFILRGSGTGDCGPTAETYKFTGGITDVNRFLADAVAKGFRYTHINTSNRAEERGNFAFTLFKLVGPRGALFGHVVDFKGRIRTVVPEVTIGATATVMTLCQAR